MTYKINFQAVRERGSKHRHTTMLNLNLHFKITNLVSKF